MSISIERLRNYIREIIKQELDEASVTGNIDGGEGPPKTPYAFQGKRKKDKEKENKIATNSTASVGGSYNTPHAFGGSNKKGKGKGKAGYTGGHDDPTDGTGHFIADDPKLRKTESVVNEGRYHAWRNDETLSPKQKIGMAMRETRDNLTELERVVRYNVRLKNEMKVDSRDYWKNTHKALSKISERLVKLANKVGQLH